MCCCDHPTVNGQPGYKWQPTDAPSVRQPFPPELAERDVLLYDEPGRCGGIDSHSHHYRIVQGGPWLDLLVRHGGGDERLHLSLYDHQKNVLSVLDSDLRYWLCNAIYHAYSDGKDRGQRKEYDYWYTAAAEKRIKVQKVRGRDAVKVRIKPRVLQEVA